MPKPSKFYTSSEAAEKLGVNRRTIARWIKSGKIKAIVTPGGHSRILSEEFNNAFKENAVPEVAVKTILIVDDDAAVRKTLKQRLTREGFVVETASDGFKAGLVARDIKPNLIILDLMMEGIDGFEVCKNIKQNKALKDTRVLIMTGFDTRSNRERAFSVGADDYLIKGGSFKSILKHIHQLLRP